MKISLNTLRAMNKRYECSDDIAAIGVDALVEKIGAQLGAIEEVEKIGQKYQGIVIAKVISCRKHENSDHLNICLIDDGGVTPEVKRDEEGYVQVVCGAQNVREGLTVAWLPPGATVPETVGKEPFVLEAREIRGEVSNGMIASARELALGENHDGILEINNSSGQYKPGDDFADAFGLKDDVLLDIENKMFTHRPDCFGFLGVSRELAGIQGLAFKSPAWYSIAAEIPAVEADELPLVVTNEIPELVPRFTAITLRDVRVGPSPTWLQVELGKVGQRSINNIVDYTNFFMLETGQPLHAYDYDKVKAASGDTPSIVVRNPHGGEKITLLNGKTIEPRTEAIMIATDKRLIGVGGVMGGTDTEVDENTRNIIIECANFNMYSIRRTSMAHGLFTDAVTRNNKGQSPLQNKAVLAKIVDEIRQYANGKVASNVIDISQVAGRQWVHPPVPVSVEFINARLGFDLSANDMATLLNNVEFDILISEDSQSINVTAPFWRTDIETREDVVEEIGRLYGFDKLPVELPTRTIKPVAKDPLLELKQRIREELVKSGANEVLTYSFVHGNLLDNVGQAKDKAFKLSNALSPDLQYYRMSLTPSLLDKIHPNIKAGYDEFAIFELGKAHIHGEQDTSEPDVPKEVNSLSFVYAAKKSPTSAPYYMAYKYLRDLLTTFQLWQPLQLEPLAGADLYDNPWLEQLAAPFEPSRSAILRDMTGILPGTKGLIWGVVGEYRASVRKALKLPGATSGFEIDPLLLSVQETQSYIPLPRFPKVNQDITLKIPSAVPFQKLFDFVSDELSKIQPEQVLWNLEPIDIYQRDDDTEHKHVTLRLTIANYQKTMTDQEVSKLLDTVASVANDKLQAERI